MGEIDSITAMMREQPRRGISDRLIRAVGAPVARIAAPRIFCGGNEFWKQAAGITGEPLYPPSHFEPQNYPRITQPEQGEQ